MSDVILPPYAREDIAKKTNYLEDAGTKPRPAAWQASVLTITTWLLGLSKSLSWNSGEKSFLLRFEKEIDFNCFNSTFFQPHTKRIPLSGVFIPRTNLNLRTYQLMQIAFRNYIFRKKWKKTIVNFSRRYRRRLFSEEFDFIALKPFLSILRPKKWNCGEVNDLSSLSHQGRSPFQPCWSERA